MRISEDRNTRELMAAAMGRVPCDMAVKNIQFVNVFTGEVYPAVVYIHQGIIVHVEDEEPEKEPENVRQVLDGEGRYMLPGLIDAHIHIESSLMTPGRFASVVIPRGVTTVITDPHEIGNVYGEEGVRYMHDAGLDLPMHMFIDIPSCVPSVPGVESSGAVFDASVVDSLAALPHVIGLAEVMDFIGVVNGNERIMSMIEAARRNGLYLQGHLPAGKGRMISAYCIGGPHTCHETSLPGEARAKLRAGMYVDARESSICRNMGTIWEDTKDMPWRDRLTLCTDDREADDILAGGQLDFVLRKAVSLGMPPVEAVRNATIHTAQAAGLEDLGALAPGYEADFLLADSLEDLSVHAVYVHGREVARDGAMLTPIQIEPCELESRNSVHAPELTVQDLRLKAPAGCGDTVMVNVLHYTGSTSYTTALPMRLQVRDGYVDIAEDDSLCYALVANRYGTGSYTLGIVQNFGLKEGADGSTISHDCHNLTLVFKDPESGAAVYSALQKVGGGICAARDGKVTALLPLPVAGLMSTEPAEETAKKATQMKEALRSLGLAFENPLLRIATLALPVVPEAKFSDLGLVDVQTQTMLPIFPDYPDAAGH